MLPISAIVVAAGNATRMEGIDKQLVPLGDSPVLLHSIRLFNQMEEVCETVVVTRLDLIEILKPLVLAMRLQKAVRFVVGGATRQESVLAGIAACQEQGLVAIHDGARPLLSQADARKVFADAEKHRAATLGVPVKDTIKLLRADGFIQETPPRELLYQIQTPQVFDCTLYLDAVAAAKQSGKDYTDDCQLVEAIGIPVYVTKGSYQNMKITTPEDLILAEALWEESNK